MLLLLLVVEARMALPPGLAAKSALGMALRTPTVASATLGEVRTSPAPVVDSPPLAEEGLLLLLLLLPSTSALLASSPPRLLPRVLVRACAARVGFRELAAAVARARASGGRSLRRGRGGKVTLAARAA